jgi:hypothetical protein
MEVACDAPPSSLLDPERVTRSQVPCEPTWGSKYAAMRKELELGAAP